MPTNPPAFPCEGNPVQCGMSMRDWFATHALAGMLGGNTDLSLGDSYPENVSRVAYVAYMVADAMLAERERGQ